MNNEIRNRFNELKLCGQRSVIPQDEKTTADMSIVSYLQTIINTNETLNFEDLGFCYWNISDSFALLNDGYSLHLNHQKFHKHTISGEPYYLYWLVCDATQRLTLQKFGFGDYWWHLYKTATEQNSNITLFSEFHAHRAALYYNDSLLKDNKHFQLAKNNYLNFLNRSKDFKEYNFFKVIYLSLISRYSAVDFMEIIEISNMMLKYLKLPIKNNTLLPGEWEKISTAFDKRKQAEIGITSAVNSLIYGNKFKQANELYKVARGFGLKRNHYIENRLNL